MYSTAGSSCGTGAYTAPRWLPGGHAQTIYSALFASRPRVEYRRERWDTPDGDFIDLDWVEPVHDAPERPLAVLFHGLEGGSRSHYAVSLMHAARAAGWRGCVAHFRGCSGEPNRLPRAYHSGDSAEIGWILAALRRRHPAAPVVATGVSLGGNALLKWLGEQGTRATGVIDAACAISAPVDLAAAGDALGSGFNLLYTRHFLATLKRKSLAKLAGHPGLFDRRRIEAACTMREFDDAFTAPLHGFRNADDYWRRAASKPLLTRIAVPTLVINALNDPFLPCDALPRPHEVSRAVLLEFPEEGGHAGFVCGRFPGNLGWLPRRTLAFFSGATGVR